MDVWVIATSQYDAVQYVLMRYMGYPVSYVSANYNEDDSIKSLECKNETHH